MLTRTTNCENLFLSGGIIRKLSRQHPVYKMIMKLTINSRNIWTGGRCHICNSIQAVSDMLFTLTGRTLTREIACRLLAGETVNCFVACR